MEHKTMITAHAGSENTDMNSLKSVMYMCTLGTDAIEVDVRMHEGVLILTHNEPEGSPDRYARLADVFAELSRRDGLRINLDLKTVGLVKACTELADVYGVRDRILFTGDTSQAEDEYIRVNGLERWYNSQPLTDEERRHPFDAIALRGYTVYNADRKVITDSVLVEKPEAISVWTVNMPEELARFLRAGVHNITTRTPIEAMRMRDEL